MESKNSLSVSIARQPVFDEKRRLWGYELSGIGFPEQTNVAISIQSSAYVSIRQITDGRKKIIVDFSEKSILENLPYALPPILAAAKVSEHVAGSPPLMEILSSLKSDGYLIAVAGFSGNTDCVPLYQLADIVGIDVMNKEEDALAASLAPARQHNTLLLATQVQDHAQFRICRELGFSLFHGPFFKLPDHITVRSLSSNEVVRFKLLRLMEQGEPDLVLIAEQIQTDPTISFRLLAYLNSAAFAFSRKIKSIQQAIALLGWRNIKNWLRVVLLTDMSQNKDAHELVLLSAQRGLFLELVARDHDFWGLEPDSLHLLGIFSLLDALLSLSMTEIVAHLPIDNKVKSALCREPNNEYLPLLQLAQCLEEARWADGDRLIQRLNLDPGKVKVAFHLSVGWSNQLGSMHTSMA